MHAKLLTAALVLGTPSLVFSQNYNFSAECEYEAERTANVDARGARLLRAKVGSGSLKIEGKAGLEQVVIRGRACASSRQLLEGIELRADRQGGEVVVEADHRDNERMNFNNNYARLDLVIEVPMRMAVEIADGSGSVELMNLGNVDLTDGSGEITGTDLHGDVDIHDGSGSITLAGVTGTLTIRDSSGSIDLRDIGGSIDINDGSGEIQVRGARNSVRITDGSGSIGVADVAGNFTVENDGSGTIDYSNVRGQVDIPRRRRGR